MDERVLLIEDDRDLRSFLLEILEDEGYAAEGFTTADEALDRLENGEPVDLVITDLILPGMRGHELIEEAGSRWPELNVVAITAFGSIGSAVELMRKGAYDYLPKPVSPDRLLTTVRRALADSQLRREVARLRRELDETPREFVAASSAMDEVFRMLRQAAQTGHPVLLTGESGTGKELAARALHRMSDRDEFVVVNCGALPEQLLESELFGHRKGAFTGADRDRPGLFETADGGTLFLDEIGELPLPLQPKLLRALEQGEVRRVGDDRPRHFDVRIVAATNRVLEEAVEEDDFREDLFWRLAVVQVFLPPLRQRPADIPVLAEHFLEKARDDGPVRSLSMTGDTMACLTAYDWPGNARELRNAIERAATVATGDRILPEHLPDRVRSRGGASALVEGAARERVSLDDLERVYIQRILEETGGNKTRAAEILGIDRKTLYRRLESYDDVEEPETF